MFFNVQTLNMILYKQSVQTAFTENQCQSILRRQSNVTVAMGQPIELHCNAHGSPAPSVSWFHQLRDEEPMLESDSDLLYIPSAHVLDNGEYDNVEDLTTQDPCNGRILQVPSRRSIPFQV